MSENYLGIMTRILSPSIIWWRRKVEIYRDTGVSKNHYYFIHLLWINQVGILSNEDFKVLSTNGFVEKHFWYKGLKLPLYRNLERVGKY